MRLFLALALVSLIGLLVGCGGRGDSPTIDRVSRKLQTVTTANEMRTWLRRDIAARPQGGQVAPAKLDIFEIPEWAKILFGNSPPRATLHVEKDEAHDCIDLVWAHGRGIAGLLIGNVDFKPSLGGDYVTLKYAEGIFIYTPKHFP